MSANRAPHTIRYCPDTERAVSRAAAGRTTPIRTPKTGRAVWVAQGLLAAVFFFAGASKLVMPAADLDDQSDFPVLFLRFIGVCEVLGALGLVLPGLTRIAVRLTPLAAAGLVVIYLVAAFLVFASVYRYAMRAGLIARYSAETAG